MFNSWFGSKSSSTSRNTQVASRAGDTLAVTKDWYSSPSDASSVSQSTVGPSRTPGILVTSSQSDLPLDEVHASINDPSVYAPTPSLIQSTEKNDGEVVTLRTSDAHPNLEPPKTQRDSAQLPNQDDTSARPEETLFTPQDAIIAEVFGKPESNAMVSASLSDRVPSSSPMPSQDPRPSISLMTADSSPPLPSTPTQQTHTQTTKSHKGPTVTVFEPFSGAKVGEHMQVLPGNGTAAAAGEQSVPTMFSTADDRTLWSSLERILELQAGVAAMHADMEGVGSRGPGSHTGGSGRAEAGLGFGVTAGGPSEAGKAGGSSKKSRRGQTLPIGDEEQEPEAGVAGETATDTDTDHTDDEDENADDEDEDDIHGYGKRRRDEEFATIAEQFAQRKAVIGGIMNKLDDLSMALKTFHALPTPLLDLGNLGTSASRANTLSSAASSPPPFRTYPRRPSSPISSISPSQTGATFTSPTVPIPPPVPPESTLAQVAPPVPSSDPYIPTGIVPVLPRVALPTIIPGVHHVESPTDMLPQNQSIFRRRPSD